MHVGCASRRNEPNSNYVYPYGKNSIFQMCGGEKSTWNRYKIGTANEQSKQQCNVGTHADSAHLPCHIERK